MSLRTVLNMVMKRGPPDIGPVTELRYHPDGPSVLRNNQVKKDRNGKVPPGLN
jgi:hypothetical protein